MKSKAFQTRTARVAVGASLLLIAVLAAYVRFEGLGVRSLWRDELCTWHVSRMPVAESLRWGPELTKPPLYQFVLRAITGDAHPSEAMLRLPAAVCGLLVVVAGCWLGLRMSGWPVAIGVSGLLACQELQVFYSREARPYSMLVLGCMVCTLLWYRWFVTRRVAYAAGYVFVAALSVYAHYLAWLAIGAHVVWWMITPGRCGNGRRFMTPLLVVGALGFLFAPLVVRYLYYRSALFQGLEWIAPATPARIVTVLDKLTFDWLWIVLVFVPALVLWIVGFALGARSDGEKRSAKGSSDDNETMPRIGGSARAPGSPGFALARGSENGESSARAEARGSAMGGLNFRTAIARLKHRGPGGPCGLLLLWIAGSFFGLVVISWVAHPALVERYALPAGVPLLLFPLVVGGRLHRLVPIVLMLAFVVGDAPRWLDRRTESGLRELVAFLQENVDPKRQAVVLTIDATIHPGWEDSERLVFDYYPMKSVPILELRLDADNVTPTNDALKDPRELYLIVLWTDPFSILKKAGRQPLPFKIDGESYSQLLFEPYRVVGVAAMNHAHGDGG